MATAIQLRSTIFFSGLWRGFPRKRNTYAPKIKTSPQISLMISKCKKFVTEIWFIACPPKNKIVEIHIIIPMEETSNR